MKSWQHFEKNLFYPDVN